jgi:hypothetical protein
VYTVAPDQSDEEDAECDNSAEVRDEVLDLNVRQLRGKAVPRFPFFATQV